MDNGVCKGYRDYDSGASVLETTQGTEGAYSDVVSRLKNVFELQKVSERQRK